MTLTKELGKFVADLSPNRLPEEAVRVARMGFIDCIGTMIAGRKEDCVRIMTDVLSPADGPATLAFGPRKGPAPEVAWINGTAAHALDYDDVGLRGHPSTVLVPAILAEAEALDASGADMIVAYIAGYETWAELFRRDTGLLHKKGWHPTGLYGAPAAAAACASLRRLDADKAAQAIALGASQSAGLMANFGTMTKPFHAGKAAHAGITAARLAEAGFTASTDAIEHPQGFLNAISPDGTPDRTSPTKAGEEWAILSQGLGIKKYPTCYCT
ncbi:MAG: MmgE/PrpD family protein, partial [Acetobacteraceae bacterium]|nr:MmgE/PrpD family protein [Acetobacteraceae bacterium]